MPFSGALRFGRDLRSSWTAIPGLISGGPIDADHGDALVYGADERTQTAAGALGLIHTGNASEGCWKRPVIGESSSAFLPRNRRDGDGGT